MLKLSQALVDTEHFLASSEPHPCRDIGVRAQEEQRPCPQIPVVTNARTRPGFVDKGALPSIQQITSMSHNSGCYNKCNLASTARLVCANYLITSHVAYWSSQLLSFVCPCVKGAASDLEAVELGEAEYCFARAEPQT